MPKQVNNTVIAESECKWAALSYVWILCLLPILLKKDSVFVQSHAKQGFLLFVAEVIFTPIPVVGWLLGLFFLVLAVLGALQALAGKYWAMPFLGKYVEKLSL